MGDIYAWMISEQVKQGGKSGPLAYFDKVVNNNQNKRKEKAIKKQQQDYRKLIITAHSGTVASGLNLDAGDLADPFLKLGKANEKGLFKKKWFACSQVEKKTLSPNWDFHHTEILDFHSVKTILVELWDEDKLSRNDFIGRCTVDISSLGTTNIVKKSFKVYSTDQHGNNKETGSVVLTLTAFPIFDSK